MIKATRFTCCPVLQLNSPFLAFETYTTDELTLLNTGPYNMFLSNIAAVVVTHMPICGSATMPYSGRSSECVPPTDIPGISLLCLILTPLSLSVLTVTRFSMQFRAFFYVNTRPNKNFSAQCLAKARVTKHNKTSLSSPVALQLCLVHTCADIRSGVRHSITQTQSRQQVTGTSCLRSGSPKAH